MVAMRIMFTYTNIYHQNNSDLKVTDTTMQTQKRARASSTKLWKSIIETYRRFPIQTNKYFQNLWKRREIAPVSDKTHQK
uniref:Uncharacterized protein n=1 Tax=Cucumis melo TaxID=3656 RepID=A0A9I9E6S5_CUCME